MTVAWAIFDFIDFSFVRISSGMTELSFIPQQPTDPDAGGNGGEPRFLVGFLAETVAGRCYSAGAGERGGAQMRRGRRTTKRSSPANAPISTSAPQGLPLAFMADLLVFRCFLWNMILVSSNDRASVKS
jgi:hypothetical protein